MYNPPGITPIEQHQAQTLFSEINQMAKEELDELDIKNFKNINRWKFIKQKFYIILVWLKSLIKMLSIYKYEIKLMHKYKSYTDDIPKILKKIGDVISEHTERITFHLLYGVLACIAPPKYLPIVAYKSAKRDLENIIGTSKNNHISYTNY